MIETYYIGIYWGVRKESSNDCAQRIVNFLSSLSECHSLLANWFKKDNSRTEALRHKIKVEAAYLNKLLLDGTNKTDFGNEIIESLGFRFGFWNGGSDEESISINLNCGCYASRPGINSCVINLPSKMPTDENLFDVSMLIKIMKCLVAAWEPNWGTITSNQYEDIISFPSFNTPRIGWITYLSNSYGRIPNLSSSVRTVTLESQGTVLILTNDRFSVNNQMHIETANYVTNILSESDLLKPLN